MNKNIVSQSFDLVFDEDNLSEENFVLALAEKIQDMLDHELDLLLSTLYRLDVLEYKIQHVLRSNGDVARGLAQLVLERQMEKKKSRDEHQVPDLGPDAW